MLPLEIPLTRGLVAVVDEIDFLRVLSIRWCAVKGYSTFYASGPNGLIMHRFIMGLEKGDKREVDHIQPNSGLINTRENLRIVTHTENQWNRGPNQNNTSGYKGVSWHRDKEIWQAQIVAGGIAKHLGYYRWAKDASEAYQQAAEELHGEFARTI